MVQRHTDQHGTEVTADELWRIFNDEYLPVEPGSPLAPWGRFSLRGTRGRPASRTGRTRSTVDLVDRGGASARCEGVGQRPGRGVRRGAEDRSGSTSRSSTTPSTRSPSGGDATAAAYVECAIGDEILWGVGIDPSITTASLKAIISAVNRHER